MYKRMVEGLGWGVGALCGLLHVVYRYSHVHLTETQLFLATWELTLVMLVFLGIGYWLSLKRINSK